MNNRSLRKLRSSPFLLFKLICIPHHGGCSSSSCISHAREKFRFEWIFLNPFDSSVIVFASRKTNYGFGTGKFLPRPILRFLSYIHPIHPIYPSIRPHFLLLLFLAFLSFPFFSSSCNFGTLFFIKPRGMWIRGSAASANHRKMLCSRVMCIGMCGNNPHSPRLLFYYWQCVCSVK